MFYFYLIMSFSPFSSKFAPPWNHHILLLQVYKRFASFQPKFCVKHESKSKCEMNTSCSASCRGERKIRGLDPRGKNRIRARILAFSFFFIVLHAGSEAFFRSIRARIVWPSDLLLQKFNRGLGSYGTREDPSSDPSPLFPSSNSSLFCSIFAPCFTCPLSSN